MADKAYKLIIFDMDGTLADRETGELLPGVAEWFYEYGRKYDIAITTNQGGVGLRYWMEKDGFGKPEKYPTEDDVLKRIGNVCRALHNAQYPQPAMEFGQPILSLVCYAYQSKKGEWSPTPPDKQDWEGSLSKQFWRQEWRKPAPGMLLEAMAYHDYLPKETLMVGDRPEDEEAAKNAGCDFVWAWDFFGRDKPDEE